MLTRAQEIKQDTTAFCDAVLIEVRYARAKFPSASNSNMTALAEEMGELARALLDAQRVVHSLRDLTVEEWQPVWDEAVQVAAMACRVATEGDAAIVARPFEEAR